MPDTRKRVRIVTNYPGYPSHVPVTLVDGEPLRRARARVGGTDPPLDHSHDSGIPLVELTLLGVDVELDIEANPDYLVKVVGPAPHSPAE